MTWAQLEEEGEARAEKIENLGKPYGRLRWEIEHLRVMDLALQDASPRSAASGNRTPDERDPPAERLVTQG